MNTPDSHPDSEQLDRLRAGLLDDDPALKAALEAHLANCERCSERHDWRGGLTPGALPFSPPRERLENIRAQVLAHPVERRRLVPLAVAAALALVAMVLVRPALQDDPGQTRVAETRMDSTPVLYEDLDFYLWLADHKDNEDSAT